jgi:hypothetical protein
MDELMLDIFRGTFDADAERMEVVFGLKKACERMEELAQAKPERYFVYSRYSHSVVARIDARKSVVIPFPTKGRERVSSTAEIRIEPPRNPSG